MHDGKPVHSRITLRYLKGARCVWEDVGPDAGFANTASLKREKSLGAKAAGVTVVEDKPEIALGTNLRETVVEYLR